MESLSNVVRVHLPTYLRDLPVPNSFFGWFSLGLGDWAKLFPFGVAVGGLTYLTLQGLCNTPVVGPCIQVKHLPFIFVLNQLSSITHSSMVSTAACYRRGPGPRLQILARE